MKALQMNVWVAACAFVCAVSLTQAQKEEPVAERIPELKVLDRWVGEFDAEMTIKPSVFVPDGSKTKLVVKARWVLNGRFVQSEGRGERVQGDLRQSEEYLSMMTYDRRAREYQYSFCFAVHGGGADYWGGNFDTYSETKWDERSQTMRANIKDERTGNTVEAATHWIDNDHYEWGAVTKDKDGNVLMDQTGKGTRRKE
ncbi:MAG: hypothetical protein WD768_13170 [Phycisphaeraceae bacterium]